MEVKLVKEEPKFIPVEFTVKLETQDEYNRWSSVFNHGSVNGLLDGDLKIHHILPATRNTNTYYRTDVGEMFGD